MAGGLAERAETIVVGGRVSGPPGDPPATAVAVSAGRIVALGDDDEIRSLAGPGTRVIDAEGRRVIPGLFDSHIHAVRAGLTWSSPHLDWSGIGSLREGLAIVSEAASRLPAGSWIGVVGGWHPGQMAEGRPATPAELTEAAPDHPVYVQLLYEEAWLNRRGLEAAGITAGSPDPPGSVFERDADGAPTGHLRGVGGFRHCMELMGRPSFDQQMASTRRFFSRLASLGLTAVTDPGGMGMSPPAYRPVYELWRRGELDLRLRIYLTVSRPGDELEFVREAVHYLHPRSGDEMLRLVGMGEILVLGCSDLEGVDPDFRIPPEAKALLREVVRELAANDWPVHQHAVLDTTITDILDVWEEVDREIPLAGRRFSLAHAEPISEENLQRVRRLEAGIGVQNRMVFRAADSAKAWGEDVLMHAPPLRRMLDLGIPVAAGTDATAVTPYNPWLSLWWLVTGASLDGAPPRASEHRLSRAEALDLYTRGSAWLSFDEQRQGVLAPGKRADLAVLSEDYFEVAADRIPELTSVLTMVGGRVVHSDLDVPVDPPVPALPA